MDTSSNRAPAKKRGGFLKRDTILLRTLSLIVATIGLSAVLTAVIFSVSGRKVFTDMKAEELSPRAEFLASLTAEYIVGNIDANLYERAIGSNYEVWDASLYVYDGTGKLIAYPALDYKESEKLAADTLLVSVLGGQEVVSQLRAEGVGVIVGEPVLDAFGRAIGAVFLVKPLQEVDAAVSALNLALVTSLLIVTGVMLLPTYIGARSIAKPLTHMSAVSRAMAEGDFTVRASEAGTDEMVELGSSLNELSSRLEKTIGDLTFERNRLRTVLNGMGEGIIAVNDTGGLMQANPSAARLLGGDDIMERLIALPGIRDDIDCVLAGGECGPRDIPVRDTVLRVTMTALREQERARGAVMLVQNITEEHRLEQTRRDYVANVSHELRTPLTSIRGLADALCDGIVGEDDKPRYFGYIQKETMRLSRLIDDLLELSRLQSGSVALEKRAVDPEELIYDVVELYSPVAAEHGRTLTAALPDALPGVFTNPDRAEQVLIVLVDNAAKHSEGDGDIRVTARDAGDRLVIEVSNPGSIDDESIAHVFDRFYKVDVSHSGGGTGLGLSIAAEIMKLMGESLSARTADGRVIFEMTLAKCG